MSKPDAAKRPATILEPIEALPDSPREVTQFEALVSPGDRSKTQPYRPVSRSPMALLFVFDDGQRSHETLRIRQPSFVIGRTEGDVCIPHDELISSRHAEITRVVKHGRHQWFLNDLDSKNGTFVRIARALLADGMILLIGSKRYRFDLPDQPANQQPAVESQPGTQLWQSSSDVSIEAMLPTLVEITQPGDGKSFPLTEAEHWVGRDPNKSSIVLADPMVGSRHVRFYQEKDNRWWIEVTKNRNGLWVQISERQALGEGGSFQCGEQRFGIRVL